MHRVFALLFLPVVLVLRVHGQDTPPPAPEAAKPARDWTDFSWLTKWFKGSEQKEEAVAAEPTAPKSDAEPKTSTATAADWMNLDWVKDQWKAAGQFSQEIKDKMSKLDTAALKGQTEAMLVALEKGDYAEAQKQALSLDTILGTEAIQKTIPLLKIRAEESVEVAGTAIKDYLSSPDLSAVEKKAMEGLIVSLDTVARDDVRGTLSLIIIYACKEKISGHEGQIIGTLVARMILGDEEGNTGLVQWASDSLKESAKQKPMP
jgi:hypothetical protein